MKKTSLGLKKPEGTDLVNIQDMNDNMDVIEKELQARVKTTGDIKDTTVTFTQASSRANIATGEKTSTIMGKIKKWFADMTVAAFAQVITSNTDLMALTKSGYLVDALAVKNQFAEVNGKLGKMFEFGGSAQKLRVEVDFKNNNQTAFQVYAGGTTFFRVEFMTTGIIYKVSTDSGKTWVTMLNK